MVELWEKNREFLTQVLSGAGVFLVLAYIVMRFGVEGAKERQEMKDLTARIAELQRGAGGKEAFARGGVEALQKSLTARAGELCVSIPEKLADETSLLRRFVAAKEQVGTVLDRRATEEAIEVGVKLKSVDFHENANEGAAEYEDRWASLESFRRLVDALISAGVGEIKSVRCEPPVRKEIPGEPGWALAQYPITVDVTGRYADFVALFDEVNQPQKFLQVTLTTLRPKPGETGSELMGTVTGRGIRLVRVEGGKEEKKDDAATSARRRR